MTGFYNGIFYNSRKKLDTASFNGRDESLGQGQVKGSSKTKTHRVWFNWFEVWKHATHTQKCVL